jgi:hypothetical protein
VRRGTHDSIVGGLGLTLGGGRFFGHDVFVQSGRAQFVLVSYQILVSHRVRRFARDGTC